MSTTPAATVFLGSRGHIPQPERFEAETLLQLLGANAGNLMFQWAASQLIGGQQHFVSPVECSYYDRSIFTGARALVFAAANHLRRDTDWSSLCAYLEGSKLPLIILGLGAQSPQIGGEAETIAALKADASIQRFVALLKERAVLITLRGAFSQKVCSALGLEHCVTLGCPSLLLNPDPFLGQKLQAQITAAAVDPMRFGLSAAAPFELLQHPQKQALEQKLIAWAMAQPPHHRGLYIQQSGGVSALLAANGEWHLLPENIRRSLHKALAPQSDPVDFWAYMAGAGYFPLSAPAWISHLERHCDLVLGSRIHGTMAALAAGKLGLVIAHDSRTDELRETMALPYVSQEMVLRAASPSALLKDIDFDAAHFDQNRRAIATELTLRFEQIGLLPSAHLRALTQQVPPCLAAPNVPLMTISAGCATADFTPRP